MIQCKGEFNNNFNPYSSDTAGFLNHEEITDTNDSGKGRWVHWEIPLGYGEVFCALLP